MLSTDAAKRTELAQILKDHLGDLTRALDIQAPAVLRKPDVRVIGCRIDDQGRTVLIGQYGLGGVREFTRDHYLPAGDDGSSLVVQAKVLEQLALEHAAVLGALDAVEATAELLES